MKAVIFDIDGTLIESMAVDSELYFASVRSVLGEVSIRAELDRYTHVTDSGILAQIIEDNGLAGGDGLMRPVRERFFESLESHIRRNGAFPAIDGAAEFIDRLKRLDDVGIAIATGGWKRSALLKLETAGFDTDGIPIATSDDSPARRDIMQKALAALGARVDSVTYFGDAEWDRRACSELGWRFVPVGPRLGGLGSFRELGGEFGGPG